MIFLVSGEGATDIGTAIDGSAPQFGSQVRWGPMGRLVNRLLEDSWNFYPADIGSLLFLSEGELAMRSKTMPRGLALPGRHAPQGTAFFFKNARALARLAIEIRERDEVPVGAVLFRDADGTRTADRSLRQNKVLSMKRGFAAEAYAFGVPMVPQPKSEAWILCAVQSTPYQNCARFESLSGNDGSPNSAKILLDGALAAHPQGRDDLCDLVDVGLIDVLQIDMPSFTEFRERLGEVARAMLSGPPPPSRTGRS